MRFKRPQLIPLLFTLASVCALTGLGVWQVERMQWKNGMIEAAATAQAMPALTRLPADASGMEYRNVTLKGRFDYDKSLRLVAPPQGSVSGFYLLTPFQIEGDGRTILVNRGFVPQGAQESRPEGAQDVTGIIRPPRRKQYFAPENQPERNVWFYEDLAAMAKATRLVLAPPLVETVGAPQKGAWPAPGNGKVWFRNDHLHYAITWFALAIVAIVMFALYCRKIDIDN